MSSMEEQRQTRSMTHPIYLPEYLKRVEGSPAIAESAHERLLRLITQETSRLDHGARYPFFTDHLYGMDAHIERLMKDYVIPAARGFEVKKRILLLVGPVSGGKSSLVTLLKRGLERFSYTEAGALYAIQGCPMHEEPLHLIPQEMRSRVAQRLSVSIRGELCPWCQWQLEHTYHQDLNQVPLERIYLSESHRVGIGTYAPSDPKSQDIADLTGAADFQGLSVYGSESDPRAFRFDGELNVANRGLVEFQEMLKLDEKFLYQLLSLTQEGNFKTSRYQLISADEVVIGHSNEHEFRQFMQNPRNEALASRMFIQPIPYNLRTEDEVRIYRKLLLPYVSPEVHVGDLALEMAATVAILSRIKEVPKPGRDRLSKFTLYQDVAKTAEGSDTIQEGWDLGEGLSGLDPRYVINRLAALLADSDECLDPIDVLMSLKDGAVYNPFFDRAAKADLVDFVQTAKSLYDQQVEKDVLEAFSEDVTEALTRLYQNYLDNIIRLLEVGDERPSEFGRTRADERLLRSIEERMGVSETQAMAFREEIYARVVASREGRPVMDFLDHPGLRRALTTKLFDDMRDEVKITTMTPVPDRATLERIERAAVLLVASHRYCPRCAARAIRHMGGLLNR